MPVSNQTKTSEKKPAYIQNSKVTSILSHTSKLQTKMKDRACYFYILQNCARVFMCPLLLLG